MFQIPADDHVLYKELEGCLLVFIGTIGALFARIEYVTALYVVVSTPVLPFVYWE